VFDQYRGTICYKRFSCGGLFQPVSASLFTPEPVMSVARCSTSVVMPVISSSSSAAELSTVKYVSHCNRDAQRNRCINFLMALIHFIFLGNESCWFAALANFVAAPHGAGTPSFPFSLCPFTSSSLVYFFPSFFSHSLYLFSSFVHPFPFYHSSPAPFPGRRS